MDPADAGTLDIKRQATVNLSHYKINYDESIITTFTFSAQGEVVNPPTFSQ